MHDHKECEHELKYCRKCDIVYCEKCNAEWKKNIYVTSPYIVTYGDGTVAPFNGSPIATVTHSHE